MKYKRIGLIVLLALMGLAATAYAAGTIADSFVTVSYLDEIFGKPVNQSLEAAEARFMTEGRAALSDGVNARVDAAIADILAQRVMDRVTARVLENSSPVTAWAITPVTVKQGDIITGPVGAGVLLKSGSAKVWGSPGTDLVNTAAGTGEVPGAAVVPYVYYIVPADGASGIVITSQSAELLLQDGATLTHAYRPQHTAIADSLADLGLFRGSNLGYELERAPTRQEALILLIRLLGEEPAALAFEGATTFTDLVGWAEGKRYIAYGHNMGYTNGESDTGFAQYKTANLEMYLTFVLRALGYDDAAGDFVWNTTSRTLAVELGLLDQNDLKHIEENGFLRDHVVKISYNALNAVLKGQSITLGQKLVMSGALTQLPSANT